MTKPAIIALALLAFVSFARAQQPSSPPADPVVQALVRVADQIKLPAREPGVLVQLAVKEGTLVRAGQVIGKIDDSEPQVKKMAAQAEYQGALKRWKDDVEIRYARKQAEVAQAKYEQLLETNKIAEKAVAAVDLREAKLEWDHFTLAIEKSFHDQELAQYEAMTKKAELSGADLAINRRTIVAPFDGVVEELKRKQEEWVQPGDTILTLMRLDTMYVEGAVVQSQYDPHEVQGCNVTVEVELARQRKINVTGRIIKVSTVVRTHGVYYVRAEVANQQEHGNWVLREGLPGTMKIHLGTGAAGTAALPR
jgi:multidrug efflux pump subunit AcrA (membrane-fusion protein)